MRLADAFTHSCDAYPGAVGLNLNEALWGHSRSLVLNRNVDAFSFPRNFNLSAFAPRVTMNVCQALLHQSKYQEFHFGRKSSKVVRNSQANAKPLRSPRPSTYQVRNVRLVVIPHGARALLSKSLYARVEWRRKKHSLFMPCGAIVL